MPRPRHLAVALTAGLALLAAPAASADQHQPSTYDDPDYLAHDLDNMARTTDPQDAANFVDGTVDALRFALSSEAAPYSDPTSPASSVQHHWNPASASVDGDRIALVGHSLASAVTTVQQCTSMPAAGGLVEPLPDACDGQRFPIRAVVAYDRLGTSEHPASARSATRRTGTS